MNVLKDIFKNNNTFSHLSIIFLYFKQIIKFNIRVLSIKITAVSKILNTTFFYFFYEIMYLMSCI